MGYHIFQKTLKGVPHLKNVVITGSTRGIGLAMAREFLLAGCQVTLSGRGAVLPQETLKALHPYADRWIYHPCNVQSKTGLQSLWDQSVGRWGSVDIWINNAGQNAPHAFAHETDEEYVRNVIATNLTGMILGSQVAAGGMIAQGHGAIYSMEGLGSNNMIQPRAVLYGTTKHALTYFMRGLAKELAGTGVLAGRLSPGMMLTDFITKTPDGQAAAIEHDERFRKVFNILADRPEIVASFFIPRMLENKKNDAHIVWLTSVKAALRFMSAPLAKRKIL